MTLFGTVLAMILGISPTETPISVDVTASELNQIIAEAPKGAVLTFAAGTYRFDRSIEIKRSDISLTGSSDGATRFKFDFEVNAASKHGIEIVGAGETFVGNLSQPSGPGAIAVQFKQTPGLAPGNVLRIARPNTKAYIHANGWEQSALARGKRPSVPRKHAHGCRC